MQLCMQSQVVAPLVNEMQKALLLMLVILTLSYIFVFLVGHMILHANILEIKKNNFGGKELIIFYFCYI